MPLENGYLVIEINDSSDKTITGLWTFDRTRNGRLAIPAGPTFPTSSVTGSELFWNTTSNTLYRRNDANTTWDAVQVQVSGSLTIYDHESIRQLIHFIDEGPTSNASGSFYYKRVLPQGSLFPTTASWFVDSAYTIKVVEQQVVWSGFLMSASRWQMFAEDGSTVVRTVLDTFSYSGLMEYEVTRSVS